MSSSNNIKDILKFFSSVVIKDSYKAKKAETTESYTKAHYFLSALNRSDSFLLYAELYTKSDFIEVGMSNSQVAEALSDIKSVPEIFKDKLLEVKRKTIIESYEELNPYYRRLNGEPPIDDEPLKTYDGRKVTELTNEEVLNVYNEELDEIRKKYNTERYKYLNHLGKKKVSYYTARSAEDFSILYFDDTILPDRYTKRMIELYYESLIYCRHVFISDAFIEYEHFSSFLTLVIIFMTIQKFTTEAIKFGIRHEFIDLKDINDFFDSYGVPFDSKIPIKYLKRIVLNMNNLIKNKGTNKVLIDIVDLFGFENMTLFKQYLIRDIKKDEFNRPIITENDEDMYELKFVEIPIDEKNLSYAFRSSNRIYDYDEVTQKDPYWGGPDPDDLKQTLLKTEFTNIATKYLSITTLYSVSQISNEMNYFVNMLNELEDRNLLDSFFFINTNIKPSGFNIKLFDAICALQCLISYRFGYEDRILFTNTQMACLYGFNFESDLDDIIYLINNNPVLKNAYRRSVKGMEIENHFPTKRSVIDFFFNNLNIKEILEEAILKTRNYEEYRKLLDIYNSNMYAKANRNMFVKEDGSYYTRYIEYLKDRDEELALYLEEVIYSNNTGEILKSIEEIANSLELYLEDHRLENIFNGFMQLNGEVIQNYIYKLINHFKAYTTQIDKFDVYYIFNDKFTNTIKLLDTYNFGNKDLDFADNVLIDIYEYININKGVQRFDETLKSMFDRMTKFKEKDLDPDLIKILDKHGITTEVLENELIYLLELTEELKQKEYMDSFDIHDSLVKYFRNLQYRNKIKFKHKLHFNYSDITSYYLYLLDDIYATESSTGDTEKVNMKDEEKIKNFINIKYNLNIKENNYFNIYNNKVENLYLIEDIDYNKEDDLQSNIELKEELIIQEVETNDRKSNRIRR